MGENFVERPYYSYLDTLRESWSKDKENFRYENFAGSELKIPTLEKIDETYSDALKRIETLFAFSDEEDVADDNTRQHSEQGIIVNGKILKPINPAFNRHAISEIIDAIQSAVSKLIIPLDFINAIIPFRSQGDALSVDEKISPLEETGNMIRRYLRTLNDSKRQLASYRETYVPLQKMLENGGDVAVPQAIQSVIKSLETWDDVVGLYKDQVSSEINPFTSERSSDFVSTQTEQQKQRYKEREDSMVALLQKYSGQLPVDIINEPEFEAEAEKFWESFKNNFEVYNFTFSVYHCLKFLENRRSGLNALLERIVSLASVETKSSEKKGIRLDSNDIEKVQNFLQKVQSEIDLLSPHIALLLQKGFLRKREHRNDRMKDQYAHFSRDFDTFEATTIPLFEYIAEKDARSGPFLFGALKNTKTGRSHPLLGDETPAEAAERLLGRLWIPRIQKDRSHRRADPAKPEGVRRKHKPREPRGTR